jgi:hypothetical protein
MMLSSTAFTLAMLRPFLSLRYGALAPKATKPKPKSPDQGDAARKKIGARRADTRSPSGLTAPARCPHAVLRSERTRRILTAMGRVFSVERIFSAPLHRALGRRVNAGDRVAMLSTVPGDARRTVWSRVARGQRCPRYLIPPVSGERRHRSARKGRAVRRDGVSSIGARRAFRL